MLSPRSLLFPFLLLSFVAQAQQDRTFTMPDMAQSAHIDGVLDSAMFDLPVLEGFTTTLPVFGQMPQGNTLVRMCKTPVGIYVFASCKNQGARVRNEFTTRDQVAQADYFSVAFDTWNDDQNAFVFTSTAAGQRVEQRMASTVDGLGYNTPWEVRTTQHSDGWDVEMLIYYQSLRYPVRGSGTWGLQFTRYDRTTGETSTWNPQDPLVEDVVLQYGTLDGMGDIGFRKTISLSIWSELASTTPNFNGDPRINLVGIDGAIQLSPATTLQSTLLPIKSVGSSNLSGYLFFDQEIGQARNLLPQPFFERELGILAKSNTYEAKNILAETLPESKRTPNSLSLGGTVLHRAMWSTRTAKGIGILANNNFIYESDTSGGIGSQTHISVEKSLRNNSWLHVAHTLLNSSDWASLTSLRAQLRDRSNRFQLSVQGRGQAQNSNRAFDGFASLARINSQLTYGLDMRSVQRTNTGLLKPKSIFQPRPEEDPTDFALPITLSYKLLETNQLGAFFGYTRFNPKQGRWLNQRHVLRVEGHDQSKNPGGRPLLLRTDSRVLDRGFREYSWSLFAMPDGAWQSVDNEIVQTYSAPFGGMFSFSSDQRKRNVARVQVLQYWQSDEQRTSGLLAGLQSVFTQAFGQVIEIGLVQKRNNYRESRLIWPSYALEKAHWTNFSYNHTLRLTPSNNFNIDFFWRIERTLLKNRKLYKVEANGTLDFEPTYALTENALRRSWVMGTSLRWNLSPTSFTRLSTYFGKGAYLKENLGAEFLDKTALVQVQLSMIVNLNTTLPK
jgi:hypothetical protein